jgi:hypothetical protein
MYILFLPRVGLYVSFLPLVNARGKTSWHKGLPVVKTIYTYGFHELFIKQFISVVVMEYTNEQLLIKTFCKLDPVTG